MCTVEKPDRQQDDKDTDWLTDSVWDERDKSWYADAVISKNVQQAATFKY